MKNSILYIVVSLFILTSCEKVIDIDLNDADPQIAIEAVLLEGANTFVTKVSRTGNFFGGTPSNVTDAIVTISDGTTSTLLVNNNDGTYTAPAYVALENTTYTLSVTAAGESYEAVSTMPEITNLDTLAFDFQEASSFNDSGYICFLVFQDDLNKDNYFRGVVKSDDRIAEDPSDTLGINDLYIFDDQFVNGNLVVIPVFGEIYNFGDTLEVDLYSLNKPSYDFYTTIDQIVGNSGGGNVAPANPITNWSNGALGAFITTGVSTKKVVVKQSSL